MFQLIEKLESGVQKTVTEESISKKTKQESGEGSDGKLNEVREKSIKNPGHMVSNKVSVFEQQNSKTKNEEKLLKKTVPEIQKESDFGSKGLKVRLEESAEKLRSKKKKKEETLNTDEKEAESQDQNDIFQSESVGIDLTVDSTAIKQFDYNESVDQD